MKSLNTRLVVILAAIVVVLGGGAYLLRGYNVQRTARFRLESAEQTEQQAEAARQQGEFRQAAEAYKNAVDGLAWYVRMVSDDVEMHQKLGLLRADLALCSDAEMRSEAFQRMPGLISGCFEDLEEVLRKDPDRVEARRRLVDVVATFYVPFYPERYTDVRAHIARLPEQLRDDGEVLEILGWCQYHAHEDKEAEETLRRAIENAPEQITAYLRLAEVLRDRLDRGAEADQWMKKLVESNPLSSRAHLHYGSYMEGLARVKWSDVPRHPAMLQTIVPQILGDAVERALEESGLADDDPDSSLMAGKSAVLAEAARRALESLGDGPALDDPGELLATAIRLQGRTGQTDSAALGEARKSALAKLQSELAADDYRAVSAAEKHGVLEDAIQRALEKSRDSIQLVRAARKGVLVDALDHTLQARRLASQDLAALSLGENPDQADELPLAGEVLGQVLKQVTDSQEAAAVLRQTNNRPTMRESIQQAIQTQRMSQDERSTLSSAVASGVLVETLRAALTARELAAADRREMLADQGSGVLSRIVRRALEERRAALAVDDSGALLLAARCHMLLGDVAHAVRSGAWKPEYDKARVYMTQGVELYDEDVRMYDQSATLEYLAGQLDAANVSTQRDKAIEHLRQGLQKTDNNVFLLWKIANLLISADKLEEAEEAIGKLSEKETGRVPIPARNVAEGYLRGRVAFERGQWLAAIEGLESIRSGLTRFQDSLIRTDILLAQSYKRLDNVDMELEAYRRVLAVDPFNIRAMAGITEAALRSGRIDEGIDQFRRLVQLGRLPARSKILFARLLIGRNLKRDPAQRDWKEALTMLKEVAQEDPESVDVPILRAEILLAQGQADEAQKLFDGARQRNPKNVELWTRAISAAQRKEDWQRVEALLGEARKKLGDLAALRIARAHYLVTRYEKQGAAQLAELAQNTDAFPEDDLRRLLLVLAGLARQQGDWDQTEALLGVAQQRLGDTVGMRYARAQYFLQRYQGQAAERLRGLAENTEEFSESDRLRLWNFLISFAMSAGDNDQVRLLGHRILVQRPTDVQVRFMLFEMAIRQNDDSAMAEMLSEIEKVEGKGPMWLYGWAARLSVQSKGPDDKKLDQALGLIEQARKRRPTWSQLALLAGTIHYQRGDRNRALENYLKAFDMGDRNPAAIERAARLLYGQRRFDKALDVVGQLTDRQIPTARSFVRFVSELQARVEDYRAALRLARQAAAESEDYRDHVWLGNLLGVVSEQARTEGRTEESKEMLAEADKALRRAVELSDQAAETWTALIRYLVLCGRTREAETAIKQGRSKIPADEAAVAVARWYQLLGRRPQAQQAYEDALRAKPSDPVVVRAAIEFYLLTDQTMAAERLLKQLVGGQVKAPVVEVNWARRSLAEILDQRGDYRSRMAALALVEKNLTTDSVLPADRSLVAKLLPPERRREAIKMFEGLGSTAAADDMFELAKLYMADGSWPDARAVMSRLLGSHGNNPEYVAAYVGWLIKHGLPSVADDWLKKLERVSPNHFGTAQLRAEWLFREERHDEALRLVSDFIGKPNALPRNEGTRMRLVAQTLEQFVARLTGPERQDPQLQDMAQRYAMQAETLLRSYLRQQPGQEMLLAAFFARQGRIDDALREVETTWERSGEIMLSQALSLLIKRPEATGEQIQRVLKVLQAALSRHDRAPALLLVLGDVRADQGDYAAAEAAYREILKMDKGHWIAMNNLAVLLALRETRSAKLDEALQLINRAIQIAGPLPAMLDSRASVHMAQKNLDLALADLKLGIAIAPTAVKYFHRAQAHLLAGNQAEAVKAMQSAVKLGLVRDDVHKLEIDTYQKLAALLPN